MVNPSNNQDKVITLLLSASKIQRELDRKLSTHGIGISEFLILKTLNDQDAALNQVALAEALHLTPSVIARIINPMEKLHLVTKNKHPRDARMSLIAMSDTGQQIYAESSVSFAAFCESMHEFLTHV